MTELRQDQAFLIAASSLANSAAFEWDAFMLEMERRTGIAVNGCVYANAAELPTAQGRAQALRQLTDVLAQCREEARKIKR